MGQVQHGWQISTVYRPKDGREHAGHVESRSRARPRTYLVGTLRPEGAGLDPVFFLGLKTPVQVNGTGLPNRYAPPPRFVTNEVTCADIAASGHCELK